MEEQQGGLECFDFLRLSPEEETFLRQTKAAKTESKKYDTDNAIKILSVLMKTMPNTQIIKKGMTLSELINEQFINEEARDRVLDELYLENIEMSNFANFDLGDHLNYIRTQIFKKSKDSKAVTGSLAKLSVNDLKNLGIVDFSDSKTTRKLIADGFINQEGFIVGGNIDGILGLNIYTGTELDGPEDDEMSIDYYGCRPQKDKNGNIIGWYDAAGYDRYGFDKNGIHRITGQNFDERGFVKNADSTWTNIYQTDPENSGVDLLGYNHEGINPETGFDRDGYWHAIQKDGTYSVARTEYALTGKDKGLDVHGFSRRGYYRGEPKRNLNPNGFYFNSATIYDYSGNVPDWAKYDSNGFDIDGFNAEGFNRYGIHKDTSTKFNLYGKDNYGNFDRRVDDGRRLLRTIKARGLNNIENISKTDIGKMIANAMSLERVYKGISKDDPNTIKALLTEIMNKNERVFNEIMELPIGEKSITLRDIIERQNDDFMRYNEFYKSKAEQAKQKSSSRETYYSSLVGRINPVHRTSSRDFTR